MERHEIEKRLEEMYVITSVYMNDSDSNIYISSACSQLGFIIYNFLHCRNYYNFNDMDILEDRISYYLDGYKDSLVFNDSMDIEEFRMIIKTLSKIDIELYNIINRIREYLFEDMEG